MKKQYIKPAVYAESFELIEHIARCNVPNDEYGRANSGDASSCGFDIGYPGSVQTIFGNSQCNLLGMFERMGLEVSLETGSMTGIQCYNSFFDMSQGYVLWGS